jgi:putative ABC transport system ATP-binding protein
VRSLSRRLGQGGFVLDISAIDLAPGARIALVGPSGSGKSTLLGLLALALAPDRAARFELLPGGAEAIDLARLWRRGRREALAALRARLIGFVPQTGGLLPFLSLGANIALPLLLRGERAGERPARLAAALGIGGLLGRRPDQVSVGQRQRAAVARALVGRPALLLADEPTAALHPSQAAEAMALLVGSADEAGAALVVATHDRGLAEAAGLEVVALTPDTSGVPRTEVAFGAAAAYGRA